MPHDRIGDYYRAADLFVFTSTTDTQGLVMAEAEAAGLPVLLVDPDLAHGSRVLAAPSPSALADTMAALARDAGPAGPPAYGQPEFGAALAAAYRSCLENASRRIDSGHTVAR